MTSLLIVAGVLVLSFALRTSHLRFIRKAGALGVLAATFLAFTFSPTASRSALSGGCSGSSCRGSSSLPGSGGSACPSGRSWSARRLRDTRASPS